MSKAADIDPDDLPDWDPEKPYHSRDWLVEHYVESDEPLRDLADRHGISADTIYRWVDFYDLPRRSPQTALHQILSDLDPNEVGTLPHEWTPAAEDEDEEADDG